jgi:hypothetical protein
MTRGEKCWCGHVKPHHADWADGLFCMNTGCGCRHYSKAGVPARFQVDRVEPKPWRVLGQGRSSAAPPTTEGRKVVGRKVVVTAVDRLRDTIERESDRSWNIGVLRLLDEALAYVYQQGREAGMQEITAALAEDLMER